MDRRTKPERIVEVIRELDADVIALQEVVNVPGKPNLDQAHYVAHAFENYSWRFGETRPLHGGQYGNMTLSRFPVRFCRNYDVTSRGRERRGCLRVDVDVAGRALLHVFNVHLGTGFVERRHQARLLLSPDLLQHTALTGPRVIVGDFNEWTRGLTSRMMTDNFEFRQIAHLERFQIAPQPKSAHRFGSSAPGCGFRTAGFVIESLSFYTGVQAGMVELADTQVLGACA